MRKRRDIKVNNVGGASCLLLAILLVAVVCPVVGSVAFAEEGANGELVEANSEAPADGATNPDEGLMTLADNASAVGISFSPASGSTNLTPTNSVGQSAQIKVLATVNVQKSGGYSVYVKSNSQNLVGQKSSSNIIPGLQGTATYANLPVNTWGYAAKEGTVIPDNAAYKAVSTSGNGDKITENTNNKIASDTKTIALSFAAKINDTKPADIYKNTVTMSVVSSPIQLSLSDITDMQQMTTSVCENTPTEPTTGSSKQLKDTRDGKYYWVTKLKDNKCWMTQNLDLDLSTSKKLTTVDSDVPAAGWTPGFNTASQATSGTVNSGSQTETRSWSLGNYRITNPTTSSSCGSAKNDLSQCTSQFTAYNTPTTQNKDELAHYIVGNHYQWNAATAGTGGSITSGQASGSICPKGWKLPESNATTAGTFGGLLNAYSIVSGDTNSMTKLTSSPLYFVRGGIVYQSTGLLFGYAGDYGAYWSSTPSSSASYAFLFNFGGKTNTIDPSSTSNRDRYYGYSVRCIAR